MIGVLHLGLGNVGSLCQCLDRLGKEYKIITEKDFSGCDQLIFPGVGNFGKAAEILDDGWRELIKEWVHSGKPFLGICLGYQLLFATSDESPEAEGLGFFDAHCVVVPSQKIPHMGWNKIKSCGEGPKEFEDKWMYFVHSYSAPVTQYTIFSACDGKEEFAVAAWKNNVGGFQFHPEKSSDSGQSILKTFLEKTVGHVS